MHIRFTLLSLLGVILIGTINAQNKPATLARIKADNELHCGLNSELAEYSNLDSHGNHAAFDVDLCKAVAVAILGPGAHFTMAPFPDENESLAALRDGRIDLLSTATPALVNLGATTFAFAPAVLFDFQGLMVNRALGVKHPQDLAGKKICFLVETNIEVNLQAYMQRHQVKFIPFPFQEEGEMEAAFITGNCAAVTADVTQLAYERVSFRKMATDFEILPDVIAKDPLAPATRASDPALTAIVHAVADALIEAEELGISQTGVDAEKKSTDTAVQHFLGVIPGGGKPVGLDDTWAARTIQAVGNYGEVFERDLGASSPLHLDRGPNRLWTNGGLMISTAFP